MSKLYLRCRACELKDVELDYIFRFESKTEPIFKQIIVILYDTNETFSYKLVKIRDRYIYATM